ncbi:hypothetical protein ACIQPR_35125 [Streptomyces sp. NPDC091280]|uniref:hypothetical protein n=1 Tax=Streptomyces sp. NPDC091280 TaxID=3365984 RepID=UPI0037F8E406
MIPPDIPKLPGLGRTWYRRGAGYWLRRASGALLWLVLTAMMCAVVVELYRSFRVHLPPAPRVVWDWTQVAASCGFAARGWMRQRRAIREKLLNPPTPAQAWTDRRYDSRRGQNLGRAALIPALLVIPVVPSLFAWSLGTLAAAFTVREYPSEVGARRALANRDRLVGGQKRLR